MRKQITVTREVTTVANPDESKSHKLGEKLGTLAAFAFLALVCVIVLGLLVLAAEHVWSAVL